MHPRRVDTAHQPLHSHCCPLPLQLACGITREQAEGMLPHYQLYLRRQAELGEELAGGMAALRRAQHELASSAQAPLQGSLR